jgi:hypothetical protein
VSHFRTSSTHRTRLATAPMRIASVHGIGVVWKISFMNGATIAAACRRLATSSPPRNLVVAEHVHREDRLGRRPVVFDTGTDSPVSAASATSNAAASNTRASAVIASPAASSSTSPGTSSLA